MSAIITEIFQDKVAKHLSIVLERDPLKEEVDDELEQLTIIYINITEGKLKTKFSSLLAKMQSHIMKSKKESQKRFKSKGKIKFPDTTEQLRRISQERPLTFRKNHCICFEKPGVWKHPSGRLEKIGGQPYMRSAGDGFCSETCPFTSEFISVFLEKLLSLRETKTKSGFSFYSAMIGIGESVKPS